MSNTFNISKYSSLKIYLQKKNFFWKVVLLRYLWKCGHERKRKGKIDWTVKGRTEGHRQVWEQWLFICGCWNCKGSAASNECWQIHVSVVRLFILSFTPSFWRGSPAVGWASSVCGGKNRLKGQSSKGCCKWGYSWLVIH